MLMLRKLIPANIITTIVIYLFSYNSVFAQCEVILCDKAPEGDTWPCETDILSTQLLETNIEYDLIFGDSIGFEIYKNLYFYTLCEEAFGVDSITFVLRETVSAEQNTYNDLDSIILPVDPAWNIGWIKWKFTKPGVFWMDARYNGTTFATTFIEIIEHW